MKLYKNEIEKENTCLIEMWKARKENVINNNVMDEYTAECTQGSGKCLRKWLKRRIGKWKEYLIIKKHKKEKIIIKELKQSETVYKKKVAKRTRALLRYER